MFWLLLCRAELSTTERGLRSRIAQIASGERFLRGTLSERSSKCGKPNCRCADGEGHTSLYLVRSQAGGEFQKMQRLLHEVSELEWKRFLASKG